MRGGVIITAGRNPERECNKTAGSNDNIFNGATAVEKHSKSVELNDCDNPGMNIMENRESISQ